MSDKRFHGPFNCSACSKVYHPQDPSQDTFCALCSRLLRTGQKPPPRTVTVTGEDMACVDRKTSDRA